MDVQCIHSVFDENAMPVTMTIKQVSDRVADQLRRRAAANRRSLQRELLLIVERAAAEEAASVSEPGSPVYRVLANRAGRASRKPESRRTTKARTSGRLSLDELWQRARELGAHMPAESADLIRRDRDADHGH